MEQKIFSYVKNLEDIYKEPAKIADGLTRDHNKVLRTIDFYTNSEYLSGKFDELDREKPFFNTINYRITIAKIGTDLDLKDLRFEPDRYDKRTIVATMLINREMFTYLKEINFSKTLNDIGITRPKYGGVVIKKYKDTNGDTQIGFVEWKNLCFDQSDLESSPLIETHWLLPSEVQKKSDVWYNVDEFISAANKANKNKPARVEVKEITGEFPESFDPEVENGSDNEYKAMCFYIGCVGKKQFLLYKEDIKQMSDKYRYLPWERIPGCSLGRGIAEDGFESQTWINDAMISMKNVMDISGKVILSTTSKKVSGNAITGVKNGHIFELEEGKTISSLNLAPSALPQLENMVALWNTQYDKASSTFDANTGEAPTAGTPYSQTALLNQVANSPFEYQREVLAIFLTEILNDWVFPDVKKRILKKHYLVSEFTPEEIEMIDETIKAKETRKLAKEMLLGKRPFSPEEGMAVGPAVDAEMKLLGNKREVEIPESFLDIKGKISANITGELRNKSAVLQSLDSIFGKISATYNPQTGTFAALENKTLSQILAGIVELAGIPISFAQLQGKTQAPAQAAPVPPVDLSAIAPQENAAPTPAI